MIRRVALIALVTTAACNKRPATTATVDASVVAPDGVPFDNVVQVAAGQDETCVIDVSGQLFCAGGNRTGYNPEITMARPVAGAEHTTQMSLGLSSCAVQQSGTVICWGHIFHVVPDGTPPGSFALIPGLESIGHVLAAKIPGPTWALKRDGGVPMQWGHIEIGQDFVPPRPVPRFRFEGAVEQVEVGRDFCVRTAAGGVDCWDGGRIARPGVRFEMKEPVRFLPKKVVDIAAAWWRRRSTNALCALGEDGRAVCWRYVDNLHREPDVNGQQDGPSPEPLDHPLSRAHGWQDIAMAYDHACGAKRDGSVWCAGRNHLGQLGRVAPLESERLLKVPGVEHAKAVTVGETHSCALLHGGSVMCWGSNEWSQCGTANGSERTPPVTFLKHRPSTTAR